MSHITYNSNAGIGQANGTRVATVNKEGRQDVVQHSHPNSLNLHLGEDISVDTNYILVDLSDATYTDGNGSNYVHIEGVTYDIDASDTAEYIIEIGYLKEVDGAGGIIKPIYRLSGDKKAGNSKSGVINLYPNGPKCDNGFVLSKDEPADANFSSGSTLGTTLDPTGSVNPENGDLVARITIDTGSINLSLNVSYHTH